MSGKLSCPVLRGGESGDARTLPDRAKSVIELRNITPTFRISKCSIKRLRFQGKNAIVKELPIVDLSENWKASL